MAKKATRSNASRAKSAHPFRAPAALRAAVEERLDGAEQDFWAEVGLDFKVYEPVLAEAMQSGFRNLSLTRRRYLAGSYLEFEVNGGGFVQFFDNHAPVVIKEALAYFEARGLKKVATLLRRAIQTLPGGKLPQSHEKLRKITLDDLKDDKPGPINRKLEKISDAFLDGNFRPRLVRDRLRYVLEHTQDFFAPEPAQAVKAKGANRKKQARKPSATTGRAAGSKRSRKKAASRTPK